MKDSINTIVTKAQEDMENFYFQTILPYCEGVVKRTLSKKDLEEALTLWLRQKERKWERECETCLDYDLLTGQCQYCRDHDRFRPKKEETITFQRRAVKESKEGYILYRRDWFIEHWQQEVDIVCGIKPCEDCISREAVIRIAEQGQVQGFEWEITKLVTLPSVQPKQEPCEDLTDEQAIEHLQKSGWMQRHDKALSEPYLCEDCISREAVLDLCDSDDPEYRIMHLKEDVECLPSVQPTRPQGEVVNYQEETPNGFQRIKYICSNCGAELLRGDNNADSD